MMSMAGDAPNTLYNTVSTNVPGPQIPLYLAGHELLHSWGFGMLSSGIGLFIGIGTYSKYLSWGLTVDPLMIPDVWYLAQCFREAFEELLAAAEAAQPRQTP